MVGETSLDPARDARVSSLINRDVSRLDGNPTLDVVPLSVDVPSHEAAIKKCIAEFVGCLNRGNFVGLRPIARHPCCLFYLDAFLLLVLTAEQLSSLWTVVSCWTRSRCYEK